MRLGLLELLLGANIVGILVKLIQLLHQELWRNRRLLIIGLLVGVLLIVDTDLLAVLLGDLFNLLDLISCLLRPLLELFLGHCLEVLLLLLLILQLGVLVVAHLVELLHKLHVVIISRHSSCLLLILLVLDLLVYHLLLSLLLLELWLLELLLSLSILSAYGIGDLLLMEGSFVYTGVLICGDVLRLDFRYLLLKLATLQLLLLLEEHLVLLLLLLLLLDLLLLLLLGVRNQGLRLVPLTSNTGLLLLLMVS